MKKIWVIILISLLFGAKMEEEIIAYNFNGDSCEMDEEDGVHKYVQLKYEDKLNKRQKFAIRLHHDEDEWDDLTLEEIIDIFREEDLVEQERLSWPIWARLPKPGEESTESLDEEEEMKRLNPGIEVRVTGGGMLAKEGTDIELYGRHERFGPANHRLSANIMKTCFPNYNIVGK